MAVESKNVKPTQVLVPSLGEASSGVVLKWRRKAGELVVASEDLVTIETDKVTLEVPAPASGVLVRVEREAGAQVRAGEVLGVIEGVERGTRLMMAAQVEAAAGPAAWSDVPEALRRADDEHPTMAEPAALPPPPRPDARLLTRRLQGFGTTIFTEMTRLANEHKAINLAQGFPDFDGPEFIKEALCAAVRGGHGQYARMTGLPELCAALQAKYRRDYGLEYADDEVVVTAGATEAIFCAVQALCDVGDEVVLFEPYYDSYRASVCMAGAVPRLVTLHGPDWHLDAAELRKAFNARTRVVMLNSPHNPTGKVFSREELQAIAALAVEFDAVVVADEVYEHLVYQGRHLPIASLPGMKERTVTISSLGKTFSLTGWKIGWAMAPRPLANALRTAHQFVTFAVNTPAQHGAVAAVSAPREFYEQTLREYRARRDQLAEGLAQAGFEVRMPQGTYFICAGIRPFGYEDDAAFCRFLIQKVGVAAIPPSAFYDKSAEGRTYVRFAFCKKEETLRAAVERLRKLRA